ncbi:MAG: VOC family protein [Alphaproteobacteria bacterium]|nr:VOC family protein [Alphaproteobacteria bacterium]MBV9061342.1 VOC family protein [Alphaproteobacteria bacterium]
MSGDVTLAGRKLAQVGLYCRDLERARLFYRDMLGLPLLFEAGNMLFFRLEGLRLMVGLAGRPEQTVGGSIIYFEAPDIDAVGAALEEKGVKFLGPALTVQQTQTHELKLREFLDPDGNALALMGMVPKAG